MARKARTSGRIYLHLAAHLRSGAGPHGPSHKASRRLDRYATEEQLDELDIDGSDEELEEEVEYHTELLRTFRRELHNREESYNQFRDRLYDRSQHDEWDNPDRMQKQRELLEDIDEAFMNVDQEVDWFVSRALQVPTDM